MDFIFTEEGRRGNRQVKPRRSMYPQWGIAVETNAYSLYRGGTGDLLDRFIIPSIEVINERRAARGKKPIKGNAAALLGTGMTVFDALVLLATLAFILGMAQLLGIGFDRSAAALGW